MKSFIYIITAILPLASQMAMASPVAEPDEFSLKERGNGGNGWGNEHGNGHDRDHGNYHQRPEDFCKVQKTYWYHKYPCDSSETVGESNVGDTFAPVCKYQNWYQNSKGWWVKEDYKPWQCNVNVGQCP
ncbi:hypothetical protein N7526_006845 [Penicillium atrosanguineum]|nr:hypothetical protein N7526_006845 [Penicillium atrosanguineum]